MADYEPASFYAPWPLFGKKFSAQLDEIRHNQDALAPIVDATGYDLTVGSRELRDSAVFSREWGQEDFHNKFRIRWSKGSEDVEFQCNKGTEAVPNWETYFYIGCGDREIVSLENFITEKDVSVGGDFYVKGSAFIAGSGEINTGSSLGGDADVFKQKSTFDLQFRGLTAGSNITLTENANDIEIASTASGGGGGFYGVIFKETEANGTIYRDDQLNVDSNFFYLSEGGDGKPILSWLSGSVGEANTLASAGGDEGLAASQAGTVLRTKGLTAGTGVTLSSDATSVTINSTAGGFYGIVVKDDSTVVKTDSIEFTGTDFDVAQSGDGATVSLDSTVAKLSDLPPGFYGVIYRESEDGGAVYKTDTLTVDSDFFYLSTGGDGHPILSSTGGAGEANTASNLAGDEGIFSAKSVVDLQFKSLTAGTNVTLSSDANTITINSTASGSGGGGGFYGVIFKETKAGGPVYRDDQLNVDSTYFYLSSSTDAKPLLSLSGVPKMEVHHRVTAATEWQISHSLSTSQLIAQAWDTGNQLVIPDKVDSSNPALVYFYFSPALAGYATLSGLPS